MYKKEESEKKQKRAKGLDKKAWRKGDKQNGVNNEQSRIPPEASP